MPLKYKQPKIHLEQLYTQVIKNIVQIPNWERKDLTDWLFTAPKILAIRQRAKEDKSPINAEMGRNSSGLYTPVKKEVSPDAVADSDNTLFLPINTHK